MALSDLASAGPGRLTLASPLYRGATIAMFLSGLGFSAAAPQIAKFLVDDLGASLTVAGLFYLTNLTAPVAGYLIGARSDRTGGRLGLFRICAAAGFVSWAAIAFSTQLWMPFVLSAVIGAFGGAATSQLFAAIHDETSARPGPANDGVVAIVRMALTAGWVVGPVAGSFLAAQTSLRVMLLATAVATLAQIVPLGGLRTAPPTDPGTADLGTARPGTARAGTGTAGPGGADLGLADPGLAGPGLAGPGLAGPGLAGPGLAGPGLAGPGLAGPGLAGPGGADRGLAAPGPGTSGPGLADPGLAGPGLPGPGTASRGTAKPGFADPGLAGPGGAGPGTAGPGTAGPGLAGPGLAGPGLADPGLANPGLAGPGVSGPGTARPGFADPGSAGPGGAGPGTAGPGTTGAGTAGPGLAGPGTAGPGAARGRRGWGGLQGAWPLLAFTGLYVLVYAGESIKYAYLPIYMSDRLHFAAGLSGAVIGIQPLVELILMPLAVLVSRRIGVMPLMVLGAAFGVAANVCFAVTGTAAGLFTGQILMGGVWGIFAALGIIVAQGLLPTAVATASAVFLSSTAVSSALGGAAGGIGAAVIGLPAVFFVPAGFALLAVAGLAVMTRSQHHDRRPT